MASPAAQRPSITLTLRDLFERRAFIRIPTEGKIRICEAAGAPWLDKNPEATLHSGQREAIGRPERTKLIHGGSRYGKSVLGGCELLCEALLPWTKSAVVASRYDHVAHEWQYLYRGLKTLFKDHGQAFVRLKFVHRPSQHDYDFETIWGSEGRGFSVDADEGAALLGQAFTRVVLGEGSHISNEILEKKVMRAIDGALLHDRFGMPSHYSGWLTNYTTPAGDDGCSAAMWDSVQRRTKGNPKKLWLGAVPFAESIWIREAAVTENPAYDLGVFEARRRSLSKEAFDEQYLGKMTAKSGRVLSAFDREKHVYEADGDDPRAPTLDELKNASLALGIDTGSYFGCVLKAFAARDGKNVKWTMGETYLEQADIYTALKAVEEMVIEKLGPVFGSDQFEDLIQLIPVTAIDVASQHKLEIMEIWGEYGVGLQSAPGMYGGKLELIPSLDTMNAWIRAGEWYVSDDCPVLIDMIGKYIWKVVKSPQAKGMKTIKGPRDIYDHLIDADRFASFCLEVHGVPDEPLPAVTLKEAFEQAQRAAAWGPLRKIMDGKRVRHQRKGDQPRVLG